MKKENDGNVIEFMCPYCNAKLMEVISASEGTNIIASVKCKRCKNVVELPIKFKIKRKYRPYTYDEYGRYHYG